MEKSTEQLIHYLPYQLQCVIVDDKTDDFQYEDFAEDLNIFRPNAVWELIGFNNSKELNIPLGEGELKGFLYRYGITYVNFHRGILPILRPLSDLTKEIEVNGDKFIPVVKLLKIAIKDNGQNIERSKINPYYCSNGIGDLICGADNDIMNVMYYSEKMLFRASNKITKFDVYPYQNKLRSKLFEWHFDVFGLIEKGLAIDINTLNNG